MPRFVKAVAFDFGHTLVNEQTVDDRIQLMPGVREVLPQISLPMAVWANTRTANESALREKLRVAEIARYFCAVATSVDAGFRKPAPGFFDFAMSKWPFAKHEVLFVGNQLNTDISGAAVCGIRAVWLSALEFRSRDETMSLDDAKPSFILPGIVDLVSLLQSISL